MFSPERYTEITINTCLRAAGETLVPAGPGSDPLVCQSPLNRLQAVGVLALCLSPLAAGLSHLVGSSGPTAVRLELPASNALEGDGNTWPGVDRPQVLKHSWLLPVADNWPHTAEDAQMSLDPPAQPGLPASPTSPPSLPRCLAGDFHLQLR